VEPLPEVERGEIHVRAPPELDRDVGAAGPRTGGDLPNPLHDRDGLLDRLRDERLHLARADPRVLRLDRDRREREVRQEIDLEPCVRDDPEDHDGHERHGDGDGPGDRKVDELHRSASPPFAAAAPGSPPSARAGRASASLPAARFAVTGCPFSSITFTSAFARRLSWPTITTVSPRLTPALISTDSPL